MRCFGMFVLMCAAAGALVPLAHASATQSAATAKAAVQDTREHGLAAPSLRNRRMLSAGAPQTLRSCKDAQAAGGSIDREYIMTIGGRPGVSIWCHGMRTQTPTEYITLLHTDMNNTQQQSNFAAFGGAVGQEALALSTFYTKVRFSVTALQILTTVQTYAFSNEGITNNRLQQFMPYGTTASCGAGGDAGHGQVDLRGTVFAIDPQAYSRSNSNAALKPGVTLSSNNQVALLTAVGSGSNCVTLTPGPANQDYSHAAPLQLAFADLPALPPALSMPPPAPSQPPASTPAPSLQPPSPMPPNNTSSNGTLPDPGIDIFFNLNGTLVSLYNAGTERYLRVNQATGFVGTQSLSAAPSIPTNPEWLFYLTIVNATEGTFALQQQPLLGGRWLSAGAHDPNATVVNTLILSDEQLPSSVFKPVAALEQANVRYVLFWGKDFGIGLADGGNDHKDGTVSLGPAAVASANPEQRWVLVPQNFKERIPADSNMLVTNLAFRQAAAQHSNPYLLLADDQVPLGSSVAYIKMYWTSNSIGLIVWNDFYGREFAIPPDIPTNQIVGIDTSAEMSLSPDEQIFGIEWLLDDGTRPCSPTDCGQNPFLRSIKITTTKQAVLFGSTDVAPNRVLSHPMTDGSFLAGFRVTTSFIISGLTGRLTTRMQDFGIYLDRPLGKSVKATTTFDFRNALQTTPQLVYVDAVTVDNRAVGSVGAADDTLSSSTSFSYSSGATVSQSTSLTTGITHTVGTEISFGNDASFVKATVSYSVSFSSEEEHGYSEETSFENTTQVTYGNIKLTTPGGSFLKKFQIYSKSELNIPFTSNLTLTNNLGETTTINGLPGVLSGVAYNEAFSVICDLNLINGTHSSTAKDCGIDAVQLSSISGDSTD